MLKIMNNVHNEEHQESGMQYLEFRMRLDLWKQQNNSVFLRPYWIFFCWVLSFNQILVTFET